MFKVPWFSYTKPFSEPKLQYSNRCPGIFNVLNYDNFHAFVFAENPATMSGWHPMIPLPCEQIIRILVFGGQEAIRFFFNFVSVI